MSKNSSYGFTDEAATEDLFGIDNYITGLAKFIGTCNTPMTISIQGTWGTGKTSIMSMVKNKFDEGTLAGTIKPIWFNTWEFSQFNMDDKLATSFLSCLINEFDLKDEKIKEKANKLMKGLHFALGVGKDLALHYLELKTSGYIAGKADETTQELFKNSENIMEPVQAIKELRQQFAECVEQVKKNNHCDRIVVFVDDLDRLEPRRAVELLEVLKVFLDCKNCVFVLAIDYDVVCRGVAAKYGELADDKNASAEKGKSFFDKIIQVPFKMPISRYKIEQYVSDCFKQIDFPVDDDQISDYVDLIKYSIGVNPRAMKRLFNSFQLLTIVVPDEITKEKKNYRLLFAILCLQYCSESIYDFVVRNSDSLEYDIFDLLADIKLDDIKRKYEDSDELEQDDLVSAKPFLEKFKAIIDLDGNNQISDNEWANFCNVLQFSAITSASDGSEIKRSRAQLVTLDELNLKQNSQEDLEDFLEIIEGNAGDVLGEPIFKNRRDSIVIDIFFKGMDRMAIALFERKNGFAIELTATEEFFDKIPEKVNSVIERRDKMKITKFRKGYCYTTFPVYKDNEADKQDMIELLQGCREYVIEQQAE